MPILSSWPPEPADTSVEYPACKAIGNGRATYAACTRINTSGSARSSITCKGCKCPYRVCSACLQQRVVAPDIREIDPETGLCTWHTKFGADQIRPSIKDAAWAPLPSISAISKPMVTESDDDDEAAPNAEVSYEVDAATLAEYASAAKGRFTARRALIMNYLGEGGDRAGIAKQLSMNKGTLSNTLIDMARVLGVDTSSLPKQSKAEGLTKILAQISRYMKENGMLDATGKEIVRQPFVPTEEYIAKSAELMARLDYPRRKIVELLVRGLGRTEIAVAIKCSLVALNARIVKMGQLFDVPYDSDGETKAGAATRVLIAIARHPLSTIPIPEQD